MARRRKIEQKVYGVRWKVKRKEKNPAALNGLTLRVVGN